MNHSLTLRIASLGALLCLAQLVTADGSGGSLPPNYLGASLGSAKTDSLCVNLSDCGENGRSWKAYSGVRLADKIAMEGGYLTFAEQEGIDSQQQNVSHALSGYTAAGVASYALNNQINLFGKAGLWWWDHESKVGSTQSKSSGKDFFVGAGGEYNLGENLGLRAEWERFELTPESSQATKQTIDLISVGLSFSSL